MIYLGGVVAPSDKKNALRLQTVADAVAMARRRLPPPVFDYIDGGAGAEVTMRANRTAIEGVRFRPNFADTIGTDARQTSLDVLGSPASMPILVGPVGFSRSMHPSGDAAGLAAATAAGTVFCQSTMSGQSIAELASQGSPFWFQLYFLGGRAGAEQLIERAKAAECPTLVVTVDTPTPGNRERDLKYGSALPVRINRTTIKKMAPYVVGHPQWLANTARDRFTLHLANAIGLEREGKAITENEALMYWIFEPPTWTDVTWIRAAWPGKLVVKGVTTADDARRALDHGADGIVVSNHGGRQLDQVPASLESLIEIVDAVGEETTVLMDGGIRRGSDVAVALCCGARAVLIGRAWVYGLSAAGQNGVTRVLDILRSDFVRTMGLLGARSLADLNRDLVELPPDWIRGERVSL
jgi:isopentenyl diphosphate isomerase/L-lactate dehydrogenase-like FMN-dependent dehydrogenase